MSAPRPRSYVEVLCDRLSGWLYGMPAETCGFTTQNVRIPVPAQHFAISCDPADDADTTTAMIELAAVLYQPTMTSATTDDNKTTLGTILVRSPYGLEYPLSVGHARVFAARGYQVLLSACRGTAGSTGGEFVPAVDDVADGSATVLWMRQQEWYTTGRWAMLGGSYLAYAQWATVHGLHLRQLGEATSDTAGLTKASAQKQKQEAGDALAELKALAILVGPHDWEHYTFGTGAMNPDMVSWVGAMSAAERKETWLPPPFHMTWHRGRMARDLQMNGKSLMQGMETYIGGKGLPEWFRKVVTGEMEFPVCTDALYRIEGVAVLVVAGWADPFLEQSMVQYRELKARGRVVVGLTAGPWDHLGAQGGVTKTEVLQWLDRYLAPEGAAVKSKLEPRKTSVRVFDAGSSEWLESDEWPPRNTVTKKWFLGAGGSLCHAQAGATGDDDPSDEDKSSFEFNPADPTPIIGSSMLNNQAKLGDDRSLSARKDVLSFTTEPLAKDTKLRGRPVVSLYHSTSHPYADFAVRISDVQPSGTSHNISEGYMRLDKVQRDHAIGKLLEMTLVDCAHTFRAGSRIRIVVAGGCHPKYIRNLGTGQDMMHGVAMRSVTHTVHHGGNRPSSVALPLVDG